MANGNSVQQFTDLKQGLGYLQGKYGTVDSGRWEYIRQPFYSYQQYPLAGVNELTFFNQSIGGAVTRADTNMPAAGNFQSNWSFLVMAIHTKVRLLTYPNSWAGTDASTIASDLLMGFAQAGILTWAIGSFEYLVQPKPFLAAPPAWGEPQKVWAGANSATLGSPPSVKLTSRRQGLLQSKVVLLETGTPFVLTISFPGGVIPVIATGIVNDTINPLKIGVELDGFLFRPVSS